MAEQVKIGLTPQAEKLLSDMKSFPGKITEAVRTGMDKANLVVVSKIQMERLTGIGPFPVGEHKLGVSKKHGGRLRGAAWATPSKVSGDTVTSSIGDNVKYAAIHEFGGTVHIGERKGTARLRTNSRGELLRRGEHGNLATFAQRSHKQVREVKFGVRAHDVRMPERAPFRTGIKEHASEYGLAVSTAIAQVWAKMGKT